MIMILFNCLQHLFHNHNDQTQSFQNHCYFQSSFPIPLKWKLLSFVSHVGLRNRQVYYVVYLGLLWILKSFSFCKLLKYLHLFVLKKSMKFYAELTSVFILKKHFSKRKQWWTWTMSRTCHRDRAAPTWRHVTPRPPRQRHVSATSPRAVSCLMPRPCRAPCHHVPPRDITWHNVTRATRRHAAPLCQ